MPDDRELLRIHVATLFTHDGRGRLRRVNEPGAGEAPRFYLGRAAHGLEWRVRHDVDDALARRLAGACAAEPAGGALGPPPHGAAPYEALLAAAAPVRRVWAGPAYCFPDRLPAPPGAVPLTAAGAHLLGPHLAAWGDAALRGLPAVAVVRDGRAVAVCCTVRTTSAADEAGVETAPEHRGRGHAAQAVAAWALAVRAAGRIPLYSTSWENAASQAVARRLGLRRYAADLHLT